jgi:hypothetical protein
MRTALPCCVGRVASRHFCRRKIAFSERDKGQWLMFKPDGGAWEHPKTPEEMAHPLVLPISQIYPLFGSMCDEDSPTVLLTGHHVKLGDVWEYFVKYYCKGVSDTALKHILSMKKNGDKRISKRQYYLRRMKHELNQEYEAQETNFKRKIGVVDHYLENRTMKKQKVSF